MREQGIFISACIHLILLMIAFLGLPDWFERESMPEPLVITLEQFPIKDITNVKSSNKPIMQKTKTPPAPPLKPVEKPKTTTSPTPPKPKPVDKPKPKPEPKPVDKPKPKPEPVEKPKPKPEPKTEENIDAKDDAALEEVLKKIQEEARAGDEEAKPTKAPPAPAANLTKSDAPYDPTIPISISERSAIVSQIIPHWRIPAGSADDYSLKVSVDVELRQDGSVISARPASSQAGRMASDTVFRAAMDSAIRAVYKASPLKNLPMNKYGSWKSLTLNFDPSMQLY
jgi:colicin import membrane protein